MSEFRQTIPTPNGTIGLLGLRALIQERNPLAALQVFHHHLGDVFQINLPGFKPVVMVGPQAARFLLVQQREHLYWRNEGDPVTRLLRHGILVEDGEFHDDLRRLMSPALHKRLLADYFPVMQSCIERVVSQWNDGVEIDMMMEMRKIALLILMDALLRIDFYPELTLLWKPILDSIRFISPGLWMVWNGSPRPRYKESLLKLDYYLHQIIAERRRIIEYEIQPPTDLLGLLINSGLDNELIRDQLLTMLIAGHDTVTANMAWTFYLLGSHGDVLEKVRRELKLNNVQSSIEGIVDLSQLKYLEAVIKESLRLYPPIHLGSRVAASDLDYHGYRIVEGSRVVYSIYLTQRHPDLWEKPNEFSPERFLGASQPPPYSWLAFGGGPRNCIGAAFGQLEARLVVATILSRFNIELTEPRVLPHMGATLEPHPGVRMRVSNV